MDVSGDASSHGFVVNFVFRVDASLQIGMGHVMRCLTLAEELKRSGHQCIFVSRAHEGNPGQLIKRKGFEVMLLRASNATETKPQHVSARDYQSWLGVDWEQDAEEVLQILNRIQPEWLVIDHYALDARWERLMASAVARIMVIDDLANREHQCDLLLDQNLGRDKSDYDPWVPKACVRLIGPAYALLREEFVRLRGRSLARRSAPELKRILVSMGGVDRDNITGIVLSALDRSNLPSHVELDIVLGSSAPHVQLVRTQATSLRFPATLMVGAADMAKRMCKADLSVGAPGSTSWERCCLGLPTLMVVLAENQNMIGRQLQSRGAGLVIDSSSIMRELGRHVVELQDEPDRMVRMSNASARLTQGLGSKHVCTAIKEVLH